MTIATSDIPDILIERIEEAHPGPALFSAWETGEWPAEVLDVLLHCGVLRPASRADSSWCPGCEWHCHKPVVSRTITDHPEIRAFIICDEEPGLDRISIPAPSLVQYGATLSAVCGFVAGRMAPWCSRAIGGWGLFPAGENQGTARALFDNRGPRWRPTHAQSGTTTRTIGQCVTLGPLRSFDR
jgi:hypothetical protein